MGTNYLENVTNNIILVLTVLVIQKWGDGFHLFVLTLLSILKLWIGQDAVRDIL